MNERKIQDSGVRRSFETGAVRDVVDGKGRCDLLPVGIIGDMCTSPIKKRILNYIDEYIRTGETATLGSAIYLFCIEVYGSFESGMLEVAKHYEEGCNKYGERNWEKGIPVHVYIDSGVRHFLKWSRKDEDEPHDRAFVWNLLGAMWTHKNKPELIDLPFVTSA